jgi:hypothetical protein
MSFTRFRKSEKSKASSVQGSQDYAESVHQQDNLSQYSHNSSKQYEYQQNQKIYPQQKQINQPQKFNNDINNIQRSEHNSQNPSVSSSSSSPDQFICNNCINEALIYEKQLNSRTNDYPNGETPLDMQKRLDAIKREQINSKINARQGMAIKVGKNLGKPTNKDLLIQENEKATFFLNNQQEDPQKKKVLDKYNQNDARNRGKKPYSDKPGVDDYYKNYVDNYKREQNEYDDEYEKKREQDKYNKALLEQIEANKKLRNKYNVDNKKYNDEMKKEDDRYMKQEEEKVKQIKAKENEMYNINLNLIEAKKKKAQDDKMLDEYDQKRKAANMRKIMEEEDEKKRQKDDETRKIWQKDLDRQILEKNQKNQLEKDRNKIPSYNAFTHEDHECCQNGKCCICKRIYPLNVLNPKKKYASLARIQKMRRQKEAIKQGK